MSLSAWILLGITWSVVIGVSGYLFAKVLTRPLRGAPPVDPRRDEPSGAAAATPEEPRRPS